MPRITIKEVDSTKAGLTVTDDNVVYIPGYAIKGPVNTPTLCTNLDEFYDIFGEVPYEFRTNQTYPDKFTGNSIASSSSIFAKAGDAELSFIYATDILQAGLPVLFERVMNTDKVESYKAFVEIALVNNTGVDNAATTLKIKSLDTGLNSAGIEYSIQALAETTLNGFTKYSLTIDGVSYVISFDNTDQSFYQNFESKLVAIELNGILNNTPASVSLDITDANRTGLLDIPADLRAADEFTVQDFYDRLSSTVEDAFGETTTFFTRLEDKGEYRIKFITTGSYPNFECGNITNNMLETAFNRGDCTALIDHTNNSERALTGADSVFTTIQTVGNVNTRKYGAMFTPWAYYTTKVNGDVAILPGSYGYLTSLGASLKTNAAWYAVAGTTRGFLSNFIKPCQVISGAVGEKFQQETGVSINPILNIKPYGYCIWGNRTLHLNEEGLVASSFLNIRMLSNDVKKVVYQTAKRLTFELNDNILWLNFRAAIEPTLDRMVSGNGLSDYKIIKKATTKKATIEAVIRLYAIEAVESWDITIELADNYVSAE